MTKTIINYKTIEGIVKIRQIRDTDLNVADLTAD